MFILLSNHKLGLFLFIAAAVSFSSFAQPEYQITLSNGVQINKTTYEFDIYLKSREQNFILTSYQILLDFNDKIRREGELSFSYIEGTSEFRNTPSVGIGVRDIEENLKFSFASVPGADSVISEEKRIGRFRITNSKPFDDINPGISWSLGEDNSTILTGNAFSDITNPSSHSNHLEGALSSGESEIVDHYFLDQNFPNPFNPSTKITFGLKDDSFVTLAVYNSLGERIMVLADEKMVKGQHQLEFDASSLASGVYFYKLEAGKQFISVKKMILLK